MDIKITMFKNDSKFLIYNKKYIDKRKKNE